MVRNIVGSGADSVTHATILTAQSMSERGGDQQEEIATIPKAEN